MSIIIISNFRYSSFLFFVNFPCSSVQYTTLATPAFWAHSGFAVDFLNFWNIVFWSIYRTVQRLAWHCWFGGVSKGIQPVFFFKLSLGMLVMVIWLGLCTCWCRPAGLHRRSSSSSLASEKKIQNVLPFRCRVTQFFFLAVKRRCGCRKLVQCFSGSPRCSRVFALCHRVEHRYEMKEDHVCQGRNYSPSRLRSAGEGRRVKGALAAGKKQQQILALLSADGCLAKFMPTGRASTRVVYIFISPSNGSTPTHSKKNTINK